jgi:CPA2 family monovalent cation:H+ antiporter-2
MLQNRGEFVLILATLAAAANLDDRLTPFAGLYVLIMAVIGPILTVNSERFGAALFRKKKRAKKTTQRDRITEENIALVEAATASLAPNQQEEETDIAVDRLVEQAMQQSDEDGSRGRRRDPEY